MPGTRGSYFEVERAKIKQTFMEQQREHSRTYIVQPSQDEETSHSQILSYHINEVGEKDAWIFKFAATKSCKIVRRLKLNKATAKQHLLRLFQ